MAQTKNNIENPGVVVSFEDIGVTARVRGDSERSFAQAVRVLRQNWRQGTVAVKGRSMVNRTNKKPFKQKGTGRARAGSARSPLWRGGGVTHGPQQRSRKLKMTRKQHRATMHFLLTDYVQGQRVVRLNWQAPENVPRTKLAYETLKQSGLARTKINFFVAPGDRIHFASLANIPNVRVLFFDQPNAVDLALADCWVYLSKDQQLFNEMVFRWI